MNNTKINIIKIVELIIIAVLTVGSFTFFAACEVNPEHPMNCRNAQLVVTTIGVVILIQGIAALVIKDERIRLGIAIAQIPLAITLFVIPGNIIHLCMMDSMRCISVFKPAVRVFSAIYVILSAVDVFFGIKTNGVKKADESGEIAA